MLGLRIERDRPHRIIRIKQDHYIADILEKFHMSEATVSGTPMAAKQSTDSSTIDLLNKKHFPFASLIGKLLYCSNCTRPDTAMAVNHMNRYMTSATVCHWEQAKRVLRYMKGTSQLSLTFNGRLPLKLLMWQDSSFGDGDARRSKTGYVAMICGSAIAWGSKFQPSVALSTTEAEYMALSATTQERSRLLKTTPYQSRRSCRRAHTDVRRQSRV